MSIRGTVLVLDANNNPVDLSEKKKSEELERLIQRFYWKGTETEKIARKIRQEQREATQTELLTDLLVAIRDKSLPPLAWVIRAEQLGKRIGMEPFLAILLQSNNVNIILETLQGLNINEYIQLSCKKAVSFNENIYAVLAKYPLPTLSEVIEIIHNFAETT
jgi:hypothetical protein